MAAEISRLLDEVRLLFHRAVEVGEQLHAREPVTMSMRAVLEYLDRHGSATVPYIARRRGVTRQHVQELVNELRARSLVALRANPDHARSSVVELTPEGKRLIHRLLEREKRYFEGLRGCPSPVELIRAAGVLSRARAALEDPS